MPSAVLGNTGTQVQNRTGVHMAGWCVVHLHAHHFTPPVPSPFGPWVTCVEQGTRALFTCSWSWAPLEARGKPCGSSCGGVVKRSPPELVMKQLTGLLPGLENTFIYMCHLIP